jgi:hypothetical protein
VSSACIEDLSAITIASWRDLRSSFEPAVNSFKSLKRVQELQANFSQLLRVGAKLLRMFDGEPDAINSDAPLVRHLEFHPCGMRLRLSLNQCKDLLSEFRLHSRDLHATQELPVGRSSPANIGHYAEF